MQLTYKGLQARETWAKAGVELPPYDVEAVAKKGQESPVWVHFGIGNIFRIFVGSIADRLIREGALDRGLTCVETFDYEVVDKIYTPFDNLVLGVWLYGDGRVEKRVLGTMAESVKADSKDTASWTRLKQIFTAPSLQMVSFTITEKGYALRGADGSILGYVKADMENGPEKVTGAMGVVTAVLYARYQAGQLPLALVSMDNVSRNGEKLRSSVLEMAGAWAKKGLVEPGFLDYVSNESKVSFPWSMIDKITPRPAVEIANNLEKSGIENMQPITTSRHTFIAPFVNAEEPQYLVVEDQFPNGRPELEKAGVYMADRDTVIKAERMKLTVCLNPIHTAMGPYDVMLGYELFADGMTDPDLAKLAHQVGYQEGLPVVPDPGIISPKAFIDEVVYERFPNKYLGDTSQRICTDISMGVPFRFGETIRAYVEKDGSAAALTGIPVAIAGWLRYLLAVDDEGNAYGLAPDPMKDELRKQMAGITVGEPDSLTDQLKPILANENIWGLNLYEAGIGNKVEEIFREELKGKGAVRAALKQYLT